MDALAKEAGVTENDDADKRVAKALACPCVKPLLDSPCGQGFAAAFACYVRCDAPPPEKGAGCAELFLGLHHCMAKHADAFQDVAESLEARQGAS